MTAGEALRWAADEGVLDALGRRASAAPALPDVAADLLRRLDLPARERREAAA